MPDYQPFIRARLQHSSQIFNCFSHFAGYRDRVVKNGHVTKKCRSVALTVPTSVFAYLRGLEEVREKAAILLPVRRLKMWTRQHKLHRINKNSGLCCIEGVLRSIGCGIRHYGITKMRRAFGTVGSGITRKTAVFGLATLMVTLCEPAWTAARSGGQTRERPNRSANNPLVKQGEYAPDFDLPRLTFATDAAGKSIGVISEKDRIRLSSFRGKRPVCLIMSSYT